MISKNLGNSICTTGYRVFAENHVKGKRVISLLSWSQRRCVKCQRFLSKKQQKYCSKCKTIEDSKVSVRRQRSRYLNDPIYHKLINTYTTEKSRKYYHENSEVRELRKLRGKVRWNPERFDVGQIV